MPNSLLLLLKWGGLVLAIVFAITLIWVGQRGPGAADAPVVLYWVLLVIGVVAAIIGFVLGRRRKPPTGA